ncbi:sulfate/molybdate ABC transporter ATP-binding protein [Patulibacter minatonensis]|uniref:sulfate/molybdate ABC transporter ATP-binding protein n=1 Tax=Patulibacter minatonensis TaxID=298163 RepID=UPI0004AEB3DC|nr:TOBE-like domain-containing protein [Patulibacter minatonensis]
MSDPVTTEPTGGDAAPTEITGDTSLIADAGSHAIVVTGLNKHYGDYHALRDVDITIPNGSLTALLGPSGSGKSTLLRAIAGLEVPDEGTVVIGGEDVTFIPPQRREIGFVFQHYAAFKHMNVRDNVGFGPSIRKQPKSEIRERVDELLEIVGLAGYQERYPSQLSGGQRQRMALARALAVQPKVLLLDEPFGALDAKVREDLRAWLRRLQAETGVTTVLVTHDQEEALDVADHIAVLNAGAIEQWGTPREVYETPANEFVMTFLGPTATLEGKLVRPHDLVLSLEQIEDAVPVTVVRVVHLGFEVRVELEDRDGNQLSAQTTRGEAARLDLDVGQAVFVRTGHPPFPVDAPA